MKHSVPFALDIDLIKKLTALLTLWIYTKRKCNAKKRQLSAMLWDNKS